MRRSWFIWFIVGVFVFVVLNLIDFSSLLPTYRSKKTKLVVWGLWGTPGDMAVVKEFERRNPDIDVVVIRVGGGMDSQKLLTSVVGKVPPDLVQQDRFSIGEWASRGAFMKLDDLIKRDNFDTSVFYPACMKEAMYEGHVYAIPRYTDDRALYWNKEVFREAGLDPERPPRTWDELVAYSDKLTVIDRAGNIKRIGFIPNYGNSWLYLYGWQNGGRFMSDDGRRCTLNHPKIVEALEWMVRFYDRYGGIERISKFLSAFQGGQYDPFLLGKIAMKIDGNWYLQSIARYAPELEFGVAPAPVPKGRPYITWSGGFSLAIPVGAKHVEEAWKFIKWATSVEGWLVYMKAEKSYAESRGVPFVPLLTANAVADREILKRFAPSEPKFRKALEVFISLMKVSRFRPVTPVGQKLWDEQVRATEFAIYHKMSPREALDRGTREVQKLLDEIYRPRPFRPVNWRALIGFVAFLGLGGLLLLTVLVFLYAKKNKLLGKEAKFGLLFVLPWVVGFVVFTLGPMIASFVLSFSHYDVLHPPNFIGFENYRRMFTEDPLFWKSLYNTFYITLFGVPLGMMAGLGLALLVKPNLKFIEWYRTAYYIPSIVPVVASSLLWIWMFHPEFGLINSFIKWVADILHVHVILPNWLGDERFSKPALILMGLWGAGGGLVFWLSALYSVPQELYEAAEIDGAGKWAKFWHITLPMISPYIFFSLVMSVISSLQTFTQAYIMTRGGPVDSTLFYVYHLFNNAFRFFRMGYACALAWVLFVIIFILTYIQMRLSDKWVHYER